MHLVELSSPWLFPIIFVLGEVPPCPSWSFKSPQLTNPFDNRASQSRWWIIICSESECINTTNELIIVFPSSVWTSGQAGQGESSPPLPYLGRRAGLVPNATIPSHRRQLHNNQPCSEDLGQGRSQILKRSFGNTKQKYSGSTALAVRSGYAS